MTDDMNSVELTEEDLNSITGGSSVDNCYGEAELQNLAVWASRFTSAAAFANYVLTEFPVTPRGVTEHDLEEFWQQHRNG